MRFIVPDLYFFYFSLSFNGYYAFFIEKILALRDLRFLLTIDDYKIVAETLEPHFQTFHIIDFEYHFHHHLFIIQTRPRKFLKTPPLNVSKFSHRITISALELG